MMLKNHRAPHEAWSDVETLKQIDMVDGHAKHP